MCNRGSVSSPSTADFLSFMDDVVKSFPREELHGVLDNLNIQKKEPAETMAVEPSTGALPQHAHARLLDEHGRMLVSILI
jgi:hypothetical protein